MPVVATNTAANTATRFLNNNTSMASSSVGKLASGSRIVRASDDAAGLAIASRLNSDVVALQQASINASQGASMVQVADGGLARIGDVLQRMKALAAAAELYPDARTYTDWRTTRRSCGPDLRRANDTPDLSPRGDHAPVITC